MCAGARVTRPFLSEPKSRARWSCRAYARQGFGVNREKLMLNWWALAGEKR
jgi:hypothetical protein